MTSVVAVRRVSRTLQRFPIQAHRARQTASLLGGQQAGGTQATQGTPLVVPCGDPCTATISASGDSLFGAFLLGNSLVGGSTGSQPPVLKNPTNIPPQGSQSDPSGVSPDGGTVAVCGNCLQDVALKTYPVMNSGWDLVGLDFVQGILASGAQFTNHMRPRHASNARYPQKPGMYLSPKSSSTLRILSINSGSGQSLTVARSPKCESRIQARVRANGLESPFAVIRYSTSPTTMRPAKYTTGSAKRLSGSAG